MPLTWEHLIAGAAEHNPRSLAQLITRVENREPGWQQAMKRVFAAGAGNTLVIGITGPPGAGKSTLTGSIAGNLSQRGKTVGVIAVDPSSPFSGGALLGDRIRMTDVDNAPGIFIRSMATRGALGGLSQSARDVTRILDMAGKDVVLIETVGVGQDEIDVVRTANLVIVVSVPGQGDGLQAIKAGIMEIADIYVVNKADRDGADGVVADINAMLELADYETGQLPPVIKTTAFDHGGVDELVEICLAMQESGIKTKLCDEVRYTQEILSLLEGEMRHRIQQYFCKSEHHLSNAVQAIVRREADPYSTAEAMMQEMQGLTMFQSQKGNS